MILEYDLSLVFDLAETVWKVVDGVKSAVVGTFPLHFRSAHLQVEVYKALFPGVDGQLVIYRAEISRIPKIYIRSCLLFLR